MVRVRTIYQNKKLCISLWAWLLIKTMWMAEELEQGTSFPVVIRASRYKQGASKLFKAHSDVLKSSLFTISCFPNLEGTTNTFSWVASTLNPYATVIVFFVDFCVCPTIIIVPYPAEDVYIKGATTHACVKFGVFTRAPCVRQIYSKGEW